jgi:hypothetical protein
MQRSDARNARALVAEERRPVRRAAGLAWRLLVIVILALVVWFVVVVATGKAAAHEINPAKSSAPVKAKGKTFITPSGRFACIAEKFSGKAFLICDVQPVDGKGGDYPTVEGQSITKGCQDLAPGEWGNGATLKRKGKATANCSTGVNVTDRHPPVLAYGTRWKRNGFVCLSKSDALRCSNTSGSHGFRINKDVLKVY